MTTPALPQLYGVIGDPVAHSLSPLIHNGWLSDLEINAHYVAMHVPAGKLADALETLGQQGCKGVNITLPHKQDALALAGTASDAARTIGAANTLLSKMDGGWHAENTDAPGFRHGLGQAFMEAEAGRDTGGSGGPALVIGAGGAAMAVAAVFGGDQQSTVFCNRTIEKAERLRDVYAETAEPGTESQSRACGLAALEEELGACSFVVNATSLGHSGQSIDWPAGRGRLVYDLSYGKAADAFLAPARDAGWVTVDGLRMLVAQAGFSFKLWFGMEPDFDHAFARCQTALEMTP